MIHRKRKKNILSNNWLKALSKKERRKKINDFVWFGWVWFSLLRFCISRIQEKGIKDVPSSNIVLHQWKKYNTKREIRLICNIDLNTHWRPLRNGVYVLFNIARSITLKLPKWKIKFWNSVLKKQVKWYEDIICFIFLKICAVLDLSVRNCFQQCKIEHRINSKKRKAQTLHLLKLIKYCLYEKVILKQVI